MLERSDPRTLEARVEVEAAPARGGANLALSVAAREACLKLFPDEASRGDLRLEDIASLEPFEGGLFELLPRGKIERALDQYRLQAIRVSTGWKGEGVFAEARAHPAAARPGLLGKLFFHFLPVRRRVVG